MCDKVHIMYAGKIVESGKVEDIFYNPKHEYTKGLLRSLPALDKTKEKLKPIGGSPIDLLNMPKGCAFAPRCEKAMKICLERYPDEYQVSKDHFALCWNYVLDLIKEGKIKIEV